MFSIRRNVFETNSSSTHSITILTEKQWENWNTGKVFKWNGYSREWPDDKAFATLDEIIDFYSKTSPEVVEKIKDIQEGKDEEYGGITEYLDDLDDFISTDQRSDYLEEDVTTFTTPSGDKMIAFCKYGNDY